MGFLSDIFQEIKNLLTWYVIVTPWEAALRVRGGKNVTVLKAGVHWCVPIIHQVYRQSIRLRICDLPTQTLTTADGHTLTLKGMLGYEIKNIRKLYDKLQHADDALSNLVSGHIATFVAAQNRGDFTLLDIEREVLEKLDFSQYGLGNIKLRLTDFAYIRAYRIIMGESQGVAGDFLNTEQTVTRGY